MAEQGGNEGSPSLREDRRHIQDRDVELLKQTVTVKTNMEIACGRKSSQSPAPGSNPIGHCWCRKPPGGDDRGPLDVSADTGRIADSIKRLKDADILISLFHRPRS